jgi:hypothetical protein
MSPESCHQRALGADVEGDVNRFLDYCAALSLDRQGRTPYAGSYLQDSRLRSRDLIGRCRGPNGLDGGKPGSAKPVRRAMTNFTEARSAAVVAASSAN